MKPLPLKPAFTVAEMMVALTLFALAAVVLGQAVNYALQSLEASRSTTDSNPFHEEVRRHLLALQSRSAVEAGGDLEFPVVSRDDGVARTTMVRLRWEAELHDTPILNYVQVTYSFSSQAGQAEAGEGSFYAYRPAWADPEIQQRLLTAKEAATREKRELRGESAANVEDTP